MKISTAVCRQETLGEQLPRGGNSQSRQAAAIFARGASWYDVSTEQWRVRR